MTDLSIIVVTWNCKQYAIDCLSSIYKKPVLSSIEVIVVDNNSTDGTVECLRNEFSSITIISNSENKGFAVANNQAIRNSTSRYVLLLNPDTIIYDDALDQMVLFLDRNSQIAALGPSIFNADGTQQYTGICFPNNWNIFTETFYLDRLFPYSRLVARHKLLFKDYTKPFQVDYVQGSCLLLRRSVLDAIGLLDESYFMYFEETDICYRIKKSGYSVYFFPDARITHFGGGEEGHFTGHRLTHYHRSLIQFYRKHYSNLDLTILNFMLFIRSSIRILTWIGIYLVKPRLRIRAHSIIIEYIKTFELFSIKIS